MDMSYSVPSHLRETMTTKEAVTLRDRLELLVRGVNMGLRDTPYNVRMRKYDFIGTKGRKSLKRSRRLDRVIDAIHADMGEN